MHFLRISVSLAFQPLSILLLHIYTVILMAKKKKTQLKPVVRGFATTSVPKKLTVEDENPTTSEEATLEINDLDHDADSLPNTGSAKGVAYEFGIFDEECQGLQNYVDKYQEKTEKEINRAIKVNHSRVSFWSIIFNGE